ncbi:MAG: hypothetical protein V2A73_18235 [Pseudomonadota bacterium]
MSTTVAIPEWAPSGALPPVNPGSPASLDRSPYEVAITELVLRFNASAERRAILTGLLDFRQALHSIGLVRGFQWLDGSFLENVELTESRPPRDIDVVTFFYLPHGQTQASLVRQNRLLFHPRETRSRYHVDAYFVQLDSGLPEPLVDQSTLVQHVVSSAERGMEGVPESLSFADE